MTTPINTALQDLKRLYAPAKIDLSLGRLYGLLDKLDNPQNKCPPVIHVAGTNGKGSTVAYLRAMVEAAGYTAHVYTSPHLIRFNERIRLAGDLVSDDVLLALVDEVQSINDGDPISFFEITTAIAFLAFSRVPADIVLLEVGLGGRLDATNVIDAPLVSVITTISRDHCEWLGQTLGAIAAEKAGIIKPGIPCIIGHQMDWARDDVMPVFEAHAARNHTGLTCCDRDWSVVPVPEGMVYRSQKRPSGMTLPRPNLPGEHQLWNAGAAIAALETQGVFSVPDAAIREGVTKAAWPGRLERITTGKVAALIPPGWELWYDGGHNDSGGQVVARQARHWADADGMALHLVCGMLKSRDPQAFLMPLLTYAQTISCFSFQIGAFSETGPASDGAELAAKINLFAKASGHDSLVDAVRSVVRENPGTPQRILVTGTLYAYKDLF
jgi:dihydrofolate synthase/folylpolyglutamate synthase